MGKMGEATEGGDSLMIGSGTIGMLEVDVLRTWPGLLIAGICSCAVRPCVILVVMLEFSSLKQINGHDVKLLVSVPRSEEWWVEVIEDVEEEVSEMSSGVNHANCQRDCQNKILKMQRHKIFANLDLPCPSLPM